MPATAGESWERYGPWHTVTSYDDCINRSCGFDDTDYVFVEELWRPCILPIGGPGQDKIVIHHIYCGC